MKRRVLAAFAIVSFAIGCAEIYGLGDYTEQDGGVDASSDTVIDNVIVGDGGCNLCVPPLPTGWTLIAYDQAFRPSCSSSYGTPTDVQEGITAAPAACGCTCTLTKPGCTSLLVTAGDSGTCNNQSSQVVAWDGGCVTLTAVQAQNVKMATTPSGSGTCAPDASVAKSTVTTAYQGRLCELLTTPGSGCEAGICVPDPAPYAMCVRQAGVVACPSGYPVQHVVGTTLTDNRDCTACTCGFDGGTGCGGTITLYTGATCSATSQALNADGTCQTVANQTFKSLAYQPTNVGACSPSSVSPTGDAGFADPATVCCTQ